MLLRRSAANQSPRSARGFVLLEVLVAVGVAAIIMTALLRSFTSTWAGINAVREDAESMLLARALLADGSSTKIAAGSQNGTVGRYAWNMTAVVVPVAPPPPPQQQQPQQQQTAARPAATTAAGKWRRPAATQSVRPLSHHACHHRAQRAEQQP